MSKVRQKDTSIEIQLRRYLFSKGFRYRKNYKKLPGSPDIVLPKFHVAIFVNGCFWHGHNCKAGRLPKTNIEFWQKKISTNMRRDRNKSNELRKLGWKVLYVWECKLRSHKEREKIFNRTANRILESQKNH